MASKERRSRRVRTRVEVRVREADGDRTLTGLTRDLSEHGVFIETREPLPPGTAVVIELLHPDQTTRLDGVVVHSEEMPAHLQGLQDSGMGVRIVRPEERLGDSGRHAQRISPDAEAQVFFGSERRHLALHDLSTRGAALISDRPLPDIAFVRLHLKLTRASDPMQIDGVPVRVDRLSDGRTLFAVRFLDPPPDALSRIAAFVARRAATESAEEE